MKLSLNEMAVYTTIACYTDAKGISHISRETLAQLSGCNDLDTLSKYTSALQNKGLINKSYNFEYGKRLVVYEVPNPNKDWLWVSNNIFSGNQSLIGFLVKLAENKYKNTNWIGLSNTDLIKRMEISKPTFNKYMKLAKECNAVVKTRNGYLLSTDYFPLEKLPVLKANKLDELNQILLQANKDSKLYKQASWFVENDIQYEKDANKIYDEMIAGLLGKRN